MWQRILNRLEMLRTSYWFVPGVLLVGGVVASQVVLMLDHALEPKKLEAIWWIPELEAGPAQTVLIAVAGAAISLATLVFSITLIVLTLTAGQFGPRLMRRFMRDRTTQLVLGLYTATFIYCLLVLLGIPGISTDAFVPRIGLAGGMVLAVVDIAMLTFFIHHVSRSIQATDMVERVAGDLAAAIDGLFPEELGDDIAQLPSPQGPPADFEQRLARIQPENPGYLRRVDAPGLMRAATELDILVRIPRIGEFVGVAPLLEVYPTEKVDDELKRRLRGTMIVGPTRTPAQDVEYCIERLVEIAARALSPGINDPFTAISCIDQLGAAMANLGGRTMPSSHRYDDEGRLRVIADAETFADVLSHGFDPIRQYGGGQILVTTRLFEALANVARCTRDPDRLAVVRAQMQRVWITCRRDQSEDPQLPMIKRAHDRAMAVVPEPEEAT